MLEKRRFHLPGMPAAVATALLGALGACGTVSGDEASDTDSGPSGADASSDAGGEEPSRLVGSYRINDHEGPNYLGNDAAWIRFRPDHFFEVFYETDLGFRNLSEGLYLEIDDQLLINGTLFNFTRDGDALELTGPDAVYTATANDAMPAADAWVVPIEPTDEILIGERPDVDATDLAWDGDHLWYGPAYTERDAMIRFNYSEGVEVETLSTSQFAWGVAWDGANLWVSSNGYDQITKLDMATGNALQTSVVMGAWIPGIAWDGTHLWAFSSNEDTLYQYDPDMNLLTSSTPLPGVSGSGLEWADGYLYLVTGATVQKLDPSSIMAVATYALPYSCEGVAYDGTDFYFMCNVGDDVKMFQAPLPAGM